MPFQDETFDAAYAIEATCHSRALENPYKEIYRVLKPGGKFACYEWLTTEKYDESNLEHKQIIHDLEVCLYWFNDDVTRVDDFVASVGRKLFT